jgi:steroid delta-isomerase-like uncharacterized protein
VRDEERILREFYDAFNEGDVERSAAQFALKCEYEFVPFGSAQRSRAEVLEGLRSWRSAFPDGRVDAMNIITSGSMVVVEWDSSGTWTGAPIRGEKPNGRRFDRRGCAVAEVESGKIVRCRDYFDRGNMWEPLGLVQLPS